METIMVEICMGITGTVSDFVLPAHVPIDVLTREIVKLAEQAFPAVAFQSETPLLCDLEKGVILPTNLTLAQAGLRDSGRLLLV